MRQEQETFGGRRGEKQVMRMGHEDGRTRGSDDRATPEKRSTRGYFVGFFERVDLLAIAVAPTYSYLSRIIDDTDGKEVCRHVPVTSMLTHIFRPVLNRQH